MTLSDAVRTASAFHDAEERKLLSFPPFECLGIRWQVEDGEPTHKGAEWTDSWHELLDEAMTGGSWEILSIVCRTLGDRQYEPADGDLVDESLAAAASSFWDGYLHSQMEKAA